MRTGLLVTLGLMWLVLGGTCLPLVDNTVRETSAGSSLAINIADPAADQTVPRGSDMEIKWSAANLTGETATVTFTLESRSAGLQKTVLDEFELSEAGVSETLTWDTQAYLGAYSITARIETDSLSYEDTADGLVTVDAAPSFEFTAPTGDATFERGTTESMSIAWSASDESATARIGLDPDTDHGSGNEIYIHEERLTAASKDSSGDTALPATETQDGDTTSRDDGSETEADEDEPGSFEWKGKDTTDTNVPTGTYNLFATVSDGVNEVVTAEGPGQITVSESGSSSGGDSPAITEPAEDTEFLASADPLAIEYEINSDDDVLVDIKIDSDDDHANGNEQTVLSQEFVEGDSDPDPFDWDGTDQHGTDVDAGIYRVFMAVSTGVGTPQTYEAAGLVMRRDTADQPLIALLQPKAVTTVDPGDYVTITWRDDDPTEEATIQIVVDTQNDPDTLSGDSFDILTDREADPDGVQDSYAWQVPGSLAPGTYYIIAFIDSGGDGNASVAPGIIIVSDPANP